MLFDQKSSVVTIFYIIILSSVVSNKLFPSLYIPGNSQVLVKELQKLIPIHEKKHLQNLPLQRKLLVIYIDTFSIFFFFCIGIRFPDFIKIIFETPVSIKRFPFSQIFPCINKWSYFLKMISLSQMIKQGIDAQPEAIYCINVSDQDVANFRGSL